MGSAATQNNKQTDDRKHSHKTLLPFLVFMRRNYKPQGHFGQILKLSKEKSKSKNSQIGIQSANSSFGLMEVAHILEELAYDLGELPREAIESAIGKRAQITPHLLEILDDSINRIDEILEDDSYQGHLYAMYLLAQFREERAFPYLVKLFSFPGEIPHAIAGDVLTEDLARIFASVCGNDYGTLLTLIENSSLNEYVRAACQTALVILVGCGNLTRTWVIEYFRSLFEHKLQRYPSFVWDNLVASCCTLYPKELFPYIRQAFHEELIDTTFISLEDVSAVLAEDMQTQLFTLFQTAELIEDTVSEMEKWLCESDL